MSEVKTNKISSLASNNNITIDPDGTGDTIIASGKVGIGTTTPSSYNSGADDLVLATTGATGITIASGTSNNGSLFFADGTSGADQYRGYLQYEQNNNAMAFGTNGAERMRIDASGNVGIGTSSPIAQSKLTVAGNSLSVTGSDGNFSAGGQRTFMDFAGGKARIGGVGGGAAGTTLGLYVGTGLEAVSVDANGVFKVPYVYSDTNGSAANVHIGSDGRFYRSTSSRRYKNTIADATHGLTELLELRPVTYKGNNNGDLVFGGLIAEEVHDAGLTEFVEYNDDNEPDALAYANMVSLCIKAIQELSAKNDALEARITALEAE